MGDFERLAMAQVKCAQCGASIEKGDKFCKHCGTQVPDNVFRAQIQIDDTADIQRAAYETQESAIRQKQMKRDLIKDRIVWAIVSLIFLAAVFFVVMFFVYDGPGKTLFLVYALVVVILALYILYKHSMKK